MKTNTDTAPNDSKVRKTPFKYPVIAFYPDDGSPMILRIAKGDIWDFLAFFEPHFLGKEGMAPKDEPAPYRGRVKRAKQK